MSATVKLTPRQRKFVEIYAYSGNGALAARHAGYSRRTARQMAHENLTKPYICQEIQKIMPRVEENFHRYLAELNAEWKLDITTIFGEDNRIKPVHEWPEEMRKSYLIKSVRLTRNGFRVEFGNRLKVVELILKILCGRQPRWKGSNEE